MSFPGFLPDSDRFRHHLEVDLFHIEIVFRHIPRQRDPSGDLLRPDGLAVDSEAEVGPGHCSELVLLEGKASHAR
jgi:hypothetical protein